MVGVEFNVCSCKVSYSLRFFKEGFLLEDKIWWKDIKLVFKDRLLLIIEERSVGLLGSVDKDFVLILLVFVG